jgi:hypothetical protein
LRLIDFLEEKRPFLPERIPAEFIARASSLREHRPIASPMP